MKNTERIQELINKYNAMLMDPAELKEVERFIEAGLINIEDLNELNQLDDRLVSMQTPAPSLSLDDRFYAMLRDEKKAVPKSFWADFFSWPVLAPRLAFASVTLIVGFFGGMFLSAPATENSQIAEMKNEISDLKELTMLSLLEKESATDRLKAVSLTEDMDQASHKVTDALLKTLNSDDNVNVRLAALDALRPYSLKSGIRTALIRSIAVQDSPLVQIALAELMAALQEKKSLKELQKVMRDRNTPVDVKKKIGESIKVLT
ncbi:MAG: HEAT repeat domain-containing protein [Chryseolinea sp.]